MRELRTTLAEECAAAGQRVAEGGQRVATAVHEVTGPSGGVGLATSAGVRPPWRPTYLRGPHAFERDEADEEGPIKFRLES